MCICYEDFIKRLQEERIRHQISQRAMSRKAHMLPSHYFKVEKGYNRFTFYELQNICSTEVDLFYSFTGKRGSCAQRYDELFHNADVEQIICCLQMIHLCANFKRKRSTCKEEWEQIYSEIEYLVYVDIGLSEEKNIFKSVRDYNGFSQIAMAEELGMDVKKLRALECDKILPNSETIFRMYEKYGVSPQCHLVSSNFVKLRGKSSGLPLKNIFGNKFPIKLSNSKKWEFIENLWTSM